MAPRFAVYFSPADQTPLARFGERVLSRTATKISPIENQRDTAWQNLLARPRHYGFHATLKAPFELADSVSEEGLVEAVENLAATLGVCSLEGLKVKEFNGFAALAFDRQPDAVASLARQCLLQLEPLRAPLSEFDYQRRDPDYLSERQRQYLSEFGYHHVLEDFDFHMTLSGALEDKKEVFLTYLRESYAQLVLEAPVLDRLCIFSQPNREQPFVRVADIPLGDVRSDTNGAEMGVDQQSTAG